MSAASQAAENGNVAEAYAETPGDELTPVTEGSGDDASTMVASAGLSDEQHVDCKNLSAAVCKDLSIAERSEDDVNPSDYLLRSLDELEVRVEKMREAARTIDEEKRSLLDSLNTMMQSEAIDHLTEAEREELGLFIDRLITRCLTVDINIQTIRSPSQEQALMKVNDLLRDLIDTLKEDIAKSKQRLQLYLNSCLPWSEAGAIDERFQGAVLGCAAEDQKLIRKKLQKLWDAFADSDAFLATLRAISLDM
ncbi:BAG family molecular chaperone regulator 2-like [Diadema antillarum]|uniref:BAG family molecular chaperone regulator 2-like n=1 Tax=Diadema antillarum TaxID=105358 RepID=UPI003A8AAB38